MPTPVIAHQQLLTAAQAALQALTTVPAARVFVERVAPVDLADCPCINLLPDDGRFQVYGAEAQGGTGTLRAELGLRLRVHTRGDPHTAVAAPVIGEAHAALMADPSFGGLCGQLTITDSRPQATRGDDGTAGTWELTYTAIALLDERTLQILSS